MTKTIKVVHRTEYDNKGATRLTSAKPLIKKVQHHYINGTVSDISGSVWNVAKCDDNSADYITIKPPKKEVA